MVRLRDKDSKEYFECFVIINNERILKIQVCNSFTAFSIISIL